MNTVLKFLFDRQLVFLIWITVLLLIYFGFLFVDTDFRSFFFKFGPGESPGAEVINGTTYILDRPDTYYFLQTPVDSWTKVGVSYFLVFLIGVITAASNIVLLGFINEVHHSKSKNIPRSRNLYLTSLIFYPIFFGILLGGSFISNVFQIQYLIFFVAGVLVVMVPFSFLKTNGKKFVGENQKRLPKSKK